MFIGPEITGSRKRFGGLPFNHPKLRNAYTIHSGPTVLPIPTSTGDFWTNMIMPAQGWFGRGVCHVSNPGTGTDLPTVQWYSGASASGLVLSSPYVDALGVLLDYDCATAPPSPSGNGFDFACEGTSTTSPVFALDDGKQLFLNVTFGGGTHTGSPSAEWAVWLVF